MNPGNTTTEPTDRDVESVRALWGNCDAPTGFPTGSECNSNETTRPRRMAAVPDARALGSELGADASGHAPVVEAGRVFAGRLDQVVREREAVREAGVEQHSAVEVIREAGADRDLEGVVLSSIAAVCRSPLTW